jgi:hypothetical protein
LALVDKDIDQNAADIVKLLPVSMIENLLVDPEVIFEAIESVLDRTEFRTVDDVANALDCVLTEGEPREVGRRAAAGLGSSHFHPPGEVSKLRAEAEAFIAAVNSRYSHQAVLSASEDATKVVDEIRSKQRRREEFDGKRILNDFFRKHLNTSTLSRQVFAFYAARRARRRRSVVEFFDAFFASLS